MARVTGPARGLFDGLRQLAVSQREVQITGAMKPRAPHEFWHEIGTPNEPAFQNGWQHYRDSGHIEAVDAPRVAFYRDPQGFVHFKGSMYRPAGTADPRSVAFALPVGYRPAENGEFHSGLWDTNLLGTVSCYLFAWRHAPTAAIRPPPGSIELTRLLTTELAGGDLIVSLDHMIVPADLTVSVG